MTNLILGATLAALLTPLAGCLAGVILAPGWWKLGWLAALAAGAIGLLWLACVALEAKCR